MLSPINYDLHRMWLVTQEWSEQAGMVPDKTGNRPKMLGKQKMVVIF